MRNIGKNIRYLRNKANLTQEELAERLFVTRQTVSNYENGKSRPDVDMIVKIGEILDADANAVIYGVSTLADRQHKIRRVLWLTGLLIILSVTMCFLNEVTRDYRYNSYISFPYFVIRDIGIPGVYIFGGWLLMEGLSLVADFKQCNGLYVRIIRLSYLSVFVMIVLLLILDLVLWAIPDYLSFTTDGYNVSFPYIPILSDLRRVISHNTYRYPMIYSVFGILFKLVGFPKRNK